MKTHQLLHSGSAALCVLLLLAALPSVLYAQFNYSTNRGALEIAAYTGSGGAVTIPSTAYGLPVSGIGNGAFTACTSLTNATIGSGVTNIPQGVFRSCSNLA